MSGIKLKSSVNRAQAENYFSKSGIIHQITLRYTFKKKKKKKPNGVKFNEMTSEMMISYMAGCLLITSKLAFVTISESEESERRCPKATSTMNTFWPVLR